MAGAFNAGFTYAISNSNPVSQTSEAEQQGDRDAQARMIRREVAGYQAKNGAGGNSTLLMWNDIEFSPRQQALIDENQGAFESELLKAVSKNLDVDLSDTTVTRVNSVETIDAALNSGQYSRVVYYGHVLNGELTPNLNWAGMDADLFKFLMPGSVSELNVYGCQSAQFTTQLYDSSGGLKVGGMQGDLFERVNNGIFQSMYTGTRNNPAEINLYHY
jgi:hypothetical protein